MGVIPMKEDIGQEIYTRDHGTVKVDEKTWQDGRYHVVLCPNGAYQHINGLPIKDEGELVEAFGGYEGSNVDALDKAVNWFRNRHDQLENPVRPIGFHSDGYPVFADGTVPDFDDLYAFFKPGPILTASIVALQQYNERKGTGVAPKELRQSAPLRSEEGVKDAFKAATKPATPDPLKYSSRARKEAAVKAKKAAARSAKTAALKAAQPAQASPQG